MKWQIPLALLCAGLMIQSAQAAAITGDYVEARTASVFAGACHYNGELMSCGRDAIMAWNIQRGAYDGVNLSGVRVVAVVSCTDNLSDPSAARRSQITIDSSATPAQAQAALAAIRVYYARTLGRIVAVQRASVTFSHQNRQYCVVAAGLADLSVAAMPDDACCTQPNLVWYSPLTKLTGRKVGYTLNAAYVGSALGDHWQRSDENSAFYGDFSF
jgi:hypothetical protein